MHPNLMNFDPKPTEPRAARPRLNCWNIFRLFSIGRRTA